MTGDDLMSIWNRELARIVDNPGKVSRTYSEENPAILEIENLGYTGGNVQLHNIYDLENLLFELF